MKAICTRCQGSGLEPHIETQTVNLNQYWKCNKCGMVSNFEPQEHKCKFEKDPLRQLPNRPQLSEEMNKKINRIVNVHVGEIDGEMVILDAKTVIREIKNTIATAIEERTKLCKQVYVEGIDWAEWVISDELAGQLFDEDLADLLNKKEKQP